MRLSECKGQSFLINGKIVGYQSVLKMIYDGMLFGPIALVNIDTNYTNEIAGVMTQMGEQNDKDTSLNVLQTEVVEIDITKDDLKPLNASGTVFAVEKRDPSTVPLSECIKHGFVLLCDNKTIEESDVLGMIYNGQQIPSLVAMQMDTMFPHENAIAMQRLWNEEDIKNERELGLLKNKTVVIDVTAEQIEKVNGYDDIYVLKEHIPQINEESSVTQGYGYPYSIPLTDTSVNFQETSKPIEAEPKIEENTNSVQEVIPEITTNQESKEETKKDVSDIQQEYVSRRIDYSQTTERPNWNPAKEKEIPSRKKSKTQKNIWKFISGILGWGINIVLIVGATYVLTNYVLINAEIPSSSMEPTVEVGDKIIGNRLAYSLERPERGDIAIFKNPDNPSELYIKRIIGLPGETITISDGKIYIDDYSVPLEEPYLKEKWTEKNDGMVFEVPENCYLMLGDNRNISYDARYWNNTFVPKEYLVAEAVFRYFPVNHMCELNAEQESLYLELNVSNNKGNETESTTQ